MLPKKDDLGEQYKDASNLNARLQLHERFSQNTYDWQRWIFDHLTLPPGSVILELGCGPGKLWANNTDRLSSDWQITLSDFSAGMLQEAQLLLQNSSYAFTYQVIDAQSLPFADQSMDIIIANHMLYLVPDRMKAFSEIQRVLRSDGHFYATTNSRHSMKELHDLTHPYGFPPTETENSDDFSLESGTRELARWFAHIELYRYENPLIVTEVDPLIAYILSGPLKDVLTEDQLQEIRAIVGQRIAKEGAFHINRNSGLFETSVAGRC